MVCLCKLCLHTTHKFNSHLNNNRTLELYFYNRISAKYIPGIIIITLVGITATPLVLYIIPISNSD